MTEVCITELANLHEFVKESNMIEGIIREPLGKEMSAATRFLKLPKLTIKDLQKLVKAFQPDAKLRTTEIVTVGGYIAPEAGEVLNYKIEQLLDFCNSVGTNYAYNGAYKAHVTYELLHPFTDGNGRSGRMLWLWVWRKVRPTPKSFLHQFYYQTLRDNQRFL
jgi:Fic family protein